MCFKMCLDRKCGVSQGRAGTSISATIRDPASELLVCNFRSAWFKLLINLCDRRACRVKQECWRHLSYWVLCLLIHIDRTKPAKTGRNCFVSGFCLVLQSFIHQSLSHKRDTTTRWKLLGVLHTRKLKHQLSNCDVYLTRQLLSIQEGSVRCQPSGQLILKTTKIHSLFTHFVNKMDESWLDTVASVGCAGKLSTLKIIWFIGWVNLGYQFPLKATTKFISVVLSTQVSGSPLKDPSVTGRWQMVSGGVNLTRRSLSPQLLHTVTQKNLPSVWSASANKDIITHCCLYRQVLPGERESKRFVSSTVCCDYDLFNCWVLCCGVWLWLRTYCCGQEAFFQVFVCFLLEPTNVYRGCGNFFLRSFTDLWSDSRNNQVGDWSRGPGAETEGVLSVVASLNFVKRSMWGKLAWFVLSYVHVSQSKNVWNEWTKETNHETNSKAQGMSKTTGNYNGYRFWLCVLPHKNKQLFQIEPNYKKTWRSPMLHTSRTKYFKRQDCFDKIHWFAFQERSINWGKNDLQK